MPGSQRKRTWQAMNEGLTNAELCGDSGKQESGLAHSQSDSMDVREDWRTTSLSEGEMRDSEDGDGYKEAGSTSTEGGEEYQEKRAYTAMQDGTEYEEGRDSSPLAGEEALAKRRRRKGKQRNPFLDVEAQDVDVSDNEESNADIETESFIDDGD
ncbi:hypothetical protein CVT24_010189, partial [Panaeolus cyanescens]